MKTLLFAVILIVGVLLFLALARIKRDSRELPYQSSKYLLSKAERSFYGVLVLAIGKSGLVFSKVRVADVIAPKKGLNRSDWQRAFNAISSKHLDFVICDPSDCSVRLAVELDDSSHGSAKAQKRDRLLNGAFESAGLPLLRIKAARSYAVVDIQRRVEAAISASHEALAAPVQPAVSEQSAQVAVSVEEPKPQSSAEPASLLEENPILSARKAAESTSPACPRCGEPMLIRKARSGNNAGQEFWGCSAFPKCRAVVKTDA